MRKLDLLVLVSALLTGTTLTAQSWVIGPFVRPSDAPVIEPNKFYYFTDPITDKKTFGMPDIRSIPLPPSPRTET
jgi:hypothetical protein